MITHKIGYHKGGIILNIVTGKSPGNYCFIVLYMKSFLLHPE